MLYPLKNICNRERLDEFIRLLRGRIGNALEINIDSKTPVDRYGIIKILDTVKQQILRESRSRSIFLINVIRSFKDSDILDIVNFAYESGYHWVQLSVDSEMLFHPHGIEKLKSILSNKSIRDRIFLPAQKKNKKTFGLTVIVKDLNQEKQMPELRTRIEKNLLYKYPVSVHLFINKSNIRFIRAAVIKFKTWGIRLVILSPIDSVYKRARFKDIMDGISGFAREDIVDENFYLVFKDIPLCLLPRELFGFSSEAQGLYDWHRGYQIVYIPQLISEDFYSFESRRKKRFQKCYSCNSSAICRGILKCYLGDRKSRKGLYELLKKTALAPKPYSRKNQFDNSLNLTLDLRKKSFPNILSTIKADAVVFFSGGVDSTLAAYLYAKRYPNKKLVLITFLNIPPFSSGEKSWVNATLLMTRCKNIIRHIVIKIPRGICQKFVFKDLEKIYTDTGLYVTCEFCHLLRFTYLIVLLKFFFGGETIVTGLRKKDSPLLEKVSSVWGQRIGNRYDVDLMHPAYDMTKEEVFAKVKQIRLTTIYLSFFFQASCFANFIKSRSLPSSLGLKKIDFYIYRKTKEMDTLLKNVLGT